MAAAFKVRDQIHCDNCKGEMELKATDRTLRDGTPSPSGDYIAAHYACNRCGNEKRELHECRG